MRARAAHKDLFAAGILFAKIDLATAVVAGGRLAQAHHCAYVRTKAIFARRLTAHTDPLPDANPVTKRIQSS